MCVRGNYGMTKLFYKIGAEHIVLVWSLWRGYWARGGALRDWAAREGVEPHFVHSGGHAWPQDLRRLVSALAPSRTIWVHTDAPMEGRALTS